MMPMESVSSVMPPLSPNQRGNEYGQIYFGRVSEEEEEEVWSGETESGNDGTEALENCTDIVPVDTTYDGTEALENCTDIVPVDTTNDGTEALENCTDRVEKPKVGMKFDSLDDAYMHYHLFAKEEGFAVCKRNSRKGKDGKLRYVLLSCIRGGKAKVTTSNPVRPRPQSKIGCPAHVTIGLQWDGKWMLTQVVLEHNHDQSPSKVMYLKCNRVLDEHVKKRLELNDKAGIKLNKTYDSLQIEAGGPGKLSFSQKDCRNHVDKHRRSLLVEGDAEAMHNYFMKMKADNSDFFHAMDLDDNGRLRNVFWADARSRVACKEFGDVVTFDTTYLVNRYDMPFAPFVGVNHHGQSILLGCGLISHEDTESFSWLFETWKTCMWGSAPKAIITDQCMAMKNAIENVFPHSRHRWCIWHIMKKLPEKLNGYKAYEQISRCMRSSVYNSLTIEQFENAWNVFMKKYDLEDNTWLEGLYTEWNRWVPAYLKDVFWAGMSSTQRSESMNAYFDGYVHSKTTLKQFVGQYENALANKVESEKQEDVKSWNSFIPLIQEEDELEKKFQSVYTNEKVKEFHKEFVGKLKCLCSQTKEGDIVSEYEVKEWIIFGEGEDKMKKQVSFTVAFHAETNETYCECRLFEFRGMVCRHQLLVWFERGIERVPEKYVLRRWCKNVKRAHTKVRISYDNSSRSIEARRHDNICKLFNDIADLAEESQEKYDLVMSRGRELKRELVEADVVCGSTMASKSLNDSLSVGDGVTKTKQSTNILDPEGLRRKGRPPCKRMQGVVEKTIKKKRETKNKTLPNKKAKEVEEIVVDHVVGTQESIVDVNRQPSYIAQPMWPNMMPYHMHPNMAQGGSIFQFSQSPTYIGQPMWPNMMPYHMHPNMAQGSQVWGGGGPMDQLPVCKDKNE